MSHRLSARRPSLRVRSDGCQQRIDRWPVRWTAADVVQSHNAIGTDKHIAAELIHVVVGWPRHPSVGHEFEISTPIMGTPNRPEAAAVHAVGSVQRARLVDCHRPRKPCFVDVRFHELRCLECDRRNLYFERIDFSIVALQLQQMLSTQKSHQMPVKNQQQPAPGEIRQPNDLSRSARECEIWGGASD